jgi:hypothetical protein
MRGAKSSGIILRDEDESPGTVGCKARADSLAIVPVRASIGVQQSQLHR